MRIAWVGPAPWTEHGVPGVGLQLLRGLQRAGVNLDCFCTVPRDDVAEFLTPVWGVRWVVVPSRWRSDAWYSGPPWSAFLTRQAADVAARMRLGHALLERHSVRRYDAVYQFSGMELVGLRRRLSELPPIVMHPQVHAAGERRAVQEEAALGRLVAPVASRALVRSNLALRAWAQARDSRHAALVIAPSASFARRLERDYGIAAHRIQAVPNPVNLDLFSPADEGAVHTTRPLSLRFASYLAARKGCELIVALSHRLVDLAGRVRISVAGEGRLWSDYTPLMADLHPAIGEFVGWVPHDRMPEWYRRADAVLVPSHYEPFALTFAEALACGTPVVASDAVGAAEWVPPGGPCLRFRNGDLDAFEQAVRSLISRLPTAAASLRREARAEAERCFSISQVAPRIVETLEELVSGQGSRRA